MPDQPLAAVSGWLILDKPRGLGSTQGVAAVKRVLRQAGYGKVKIGHGGTLDPLAEGVLPIALGEATKLAGRMLDASKVYEFTIAFGEETDTLDTEGAVVARSDRLPTAEEVEAVLPRFTGPIEQVPPAYSALKVGGRRAYDLARAGEEVELAMRSVTVFDLGAIDAAQAGRITLRAHVSKGTYIRSLARDIARALGTVGHVTYLRRTQAGPFGQAQAISLDLLNEIGNGARLEDHLLPLEAGLDGIPAHDLDRTSAQAARQGRVLFDQALPDGLFLARYAGVPVALMETRGGTTTVVRGFNLPDAAKDEDL
ncbi:tRNA pseudouridine(55) synthase TruB [Altererythrobacter sp. TH136]|uniref:tRNA pseudouridine(55) synthase TruB n=1 Tax=Altererythrobacter sp. TH136 TaxID=2067415 RepID=UPI00116207C1|nr:tRNA pseudouridine(55) synthase TruB [Altererythrobacter sp. TH136]QDM41432.1 tRNA pseudouridine(55) synthase TruB [Altererythrobacter sp. TH136]